MNINLRTLGYLDPGTGSFIIQILLAGLIGITVAIRVYWRKIVNFFKKNKDENILNDLDKLDEYGDDDLDIN